MKFQDEGGLLLPSTIEQKISSTGKKYLALKPDAIPEGEAALGQMPTLKYVDTITTVQHRRLITLTEQFSDPRIPRLCLFHRRYPLQQWA